MHPGSEPPASSEALALRVRRSPRASRSRVSVDADGVVEVVLARGAPRRAAEEVLRELRPWIERRRAQMAAARAEIERPPGTVPLLGGHLTLVREPSRRVARRRGDALLVPAADARPAVEAWYRRTARAEVAVRLDAACARAGASYGRLSIRDQRTRWASCSSSGAMSFNWRLLLAPSEVLDYVVEHEVCHLEVRDHSRAFWRLLEERMPGWREPAAWLKRYGPLLSADSALRSAS